MESITKKYRVTFNKVDYNTEYTFHRCKSGAFEYGNGTSVIVTRASDGYEELYDTRYDPTVSNFAGWCENWLENHFNPDYEPKWEEVRCL